MNAEGDMMPAGDSRNPVKYVEGDSDLTDFQVVRKEFSNHKFDANIGFSLLTGQITFNTACINFYEDTNYVQVLVDEKGQRVAIRRCGQYDKDAMQWARFQKKDGKRVTKYIKSDIVCGRIFEMMNWESQYRYKILGTRMIYADADIVLFLLGDAVPFETSFVTGEDGKKKRKINSFLPPKWRDSFGDYVPDHDRKQAEGMRDALTLFNTSDGQAYFVQPKARKG